MAEQTALHLRDAAAATLKEELRQMNKEFNKENPSRRLLDGKLEKVIKAKEDLLAAHYSYGHKAKKQHDIEEMKN